MKSETLLEVHDMLCIGARNLLEEKVKNYSGDGCVFTNFSRVEQLGICEVHTGILARMSDKFGRLITHTTTEGGLVGDESFDDSILDLINYLVLLYCSLQDNTIGIGK
jgi:hypothetical protein